MPMFRVSINFAIRLIRINSVALCCECYLHSAGRKNETSTGYKYELALGKVSGTWQYGGNRQ
jgi:hypothetical protein